MLFGAPGTVVRGNRVVQRERVLLGAFNLVDYGPYDGNDVGTTVEDNVVDAGGTGYVKTGVAMGPATWGEDTTHAIRGAIVRNNLFVGANMGYGIVINGADNVTVVGNKASATFSGQLGEGCLQPLNAPPGPFLYSPARTSGALQKDFVAGQLQYVLCVQPGRPTSQTFGPNQFTLRSGATYSLANATLRLTRAGAIQLLSPDLRTRLFSLSSGVDCASGCQLVLDGGGRLRVLSSTKSHVWPALQRPPGAGARLTVADTAPYLTLRSGAGNLVWASSYLLPTLELRHGQYVAREVGKTTYYLRLEPDANLRVRRGSPGGKVLWSTDVVGAQCGDDCHTSLQGDGNLVTYAGGKAVFASGTNGHPYTVAGVAFASEAPYVQVKDTAGVTRWRST